MESLAVIAKCTPRPYAIMGISNNRIITQILKKLPLISGKTNDVIMRLKLFSDIIKKCHPVPIISSE
jgi:hypothetical protein